jgi:hypothetical protein
LEKALDPNQINLYGDSALLHAITEKKFRSMEILMKHQSIDLQIENKEGSTAFGQLLKQSEDLDLIETFAQLIQSKNLLIAS